MSNRENFAPHSKCHRRGFQPTPGVDDAGACAFCCREYSSDSGLCESGKFGQFLSYWFPSYDCLACRPPSVGPHYDRSIGLITSLATLRAYSPRPPIGFLSRVPISSTSLSWGRKPVLIVRKVPRIIDDMLTYDNPLHRACGNRDWPPPTRRSTS